MKHISSGVNRPHYHAQHTPVRLRRLQQEYALIYDQLEGREYLCGSRFSAADTHFYGLLEMMVMQVVKWVLGPGRKNVVAYFQRLDAREASQQALELFGSKIST
jgi:glutathione S-transferase